MSEKPRSYSELQDCLLDLQSRYDSLQTYVLDLQSRYEALQDQVIALLREKLELLELVNRPEHTLNER